MLIKEYGNNSIRRVKTDKADTVKIARYGLDNWVDFAASFWHVNCVRSLGKKAFAERYRKWCKRHGYIFSAGKADGIYDESEDLVSTLPKNEVSKVLVMSAIDQLDAVSRTVEVLRIEMNRLAGQLPEYPVVMDMYGVGPSVGPQLMAEIGDVRRFKQRGSLTAFAGVDPMPNQSGDYERKSNPASKRGSPYLRRTLFVAMTVLLQKAPSDDPVYQFIDKKRSEGKPYYVYMTAGANKFLRIYYGRVNEYLRSMESSANS